MKPYSGHISLWIGSLLMEAGDNRYSQYRHHDISWDLDNMSPWVIQGHVIMKSVGIVIPLVEFDICSLEFEYVN